MVNKKIVKDKLKDLTNILHKVSPIKPKLRSIRVKNVKVAPQQNDGQGDVNMVEIKRSSSRIKTNDVKLLERSILSKTKTIKDNNTRYLNLIKENKDVHKYVFARCDTNHDFVLDTRGNSKLFSKVIDNVVNDMNKNTPVLNDELISSYYNITQHNSKLSSQVKKILKGDIIPLQQPDFRIGLIPENLINKYLYIFKVKYTQPILTSPFTNSHVISYDFDMKHYWEKCQIIKYVDNNDYGIFIDQTDFTENIKLRIRYENNNQEDDFMLELDKEIKFKNQFSTSEVPVGGSWTWTTQESYYSIDITYNDNDKINFFQNIINKTISHDIDDDDYNDEDDLDNEIPVHAHVFTDNTYICMYTYWINTNKNGKLEYYMIYVNINDISQANIKNKKVWKTSKYYYYEPDDKDTKKYIFPKYFTPQNGIKDINSKHCTCEVLATGFKLNFTKHKTQVEFKENEYDIFFLPELYIKDTLLTEHDIIGSGNWIITNNLRLINPSGTKTYNDCVVELIENLTPIPKTINFQDRCIYKMLTGEESSKQLLTYNSTNECKTYIVENMIEFGNFIQTIFKPSDYAIAIDMDMQHISKHYTPILNTATLWDSSKSSSGIINRERNGINPIKILTNIDTNINNYIWFGDNATIRVNTNGDAVFQVNEKSYTCIKGVNELEKINKSKENKPPYIYKTVALLKESIASKPRYDFVEKLPVTQCLNIKRSGDAFQIDSIRKYNLSALQNLSAFLLTGDQLFFCNCLVSNVPAIQFYHLRDTSKTIVTIYKPVAMLGGQPLTSFTQHIEPQITPQIILDCVLQCNDSVDHVAKLNSIMNKESYLKFQTFIILVNQYFTYIFKSVTQNKHIEYILKRLNDNIIYDFGDDAEQGLHAGYVQEGLIVGDVNQCQCIHHYSKILYERMILWGFDAQDILDILGIVRVEMDGNERVADEDLSLPNDTEMCILQVLDFFFDIPILNVCFEQEIPENPSLLSLENATRMRERRKNAIQLASLVKEKHQQNQWQTKSLGIYQKTASGGAKSNRKKLRHDLLIQNYSASTKRNLFIRMLSNKYKRIQQIKEQHQSQDGAIASLISPNDATAYLMMSG